jgi:hypothetical protein
MSREGNIYFWGSCVFESFSSIFGISYTITYFNEKLNEN